MIKYQLQKRILYYAEGANAPTHFVPTINWNTYLAHRKNMPHLCRIFDTIEKAEEVATCQ